MAGKLNLKPAHVYFLRLVDDIDGRLLPYVKVGITDGPVQARINSLQTGSPFRIVEHTHLTSEAAELVERHVHRTHADRRVRGEWLRCDEDDLNTIVQEADAYSLEVGAKAADVREFDLELSTGEVLDATPTALELREQLQPLLSELLLVTKRQELCKHRIHALVGTSGGIDGVVEVSVTNPKPSFKASLFKKERSDLYERYLTAQKHKCSFSFLGKPTIRAYPELGTELKAAKASVLPVDHTLVEATRIVERSDGIAELHTEYVSLEVQKSTIEGDIRRFELELRHMCGHHAGIDGVCTYTRETITAFDEDAFKQDHPDVYDQFVRVGEPTRRVSVLKSRSYA
jgi:hypothetical protein